MVQSYLNRYLNRLTARRKVVLLSTLKKNALAALHRRAFVLSPQCYIESAEVQSMASRRNCHFRGEPTHHIKALLRLRNEGVTTPVNQPLTREPSFPTACHQRLTQFRYTLNAIKENYEESYQPSILSEKARSYSFQTNVRSDVAIHSFSVIAGVPYPWQLSDLHQQWLRRRLSS